MYKLKNVFKDWYKPQESFVVRNPLFPIEGFFSWNANDETNIESTKEILRKSLREFYIQPIAQEALYVASPDLHEQLQLWLQNRIEKDEKKEKTELSLMKYMIRMCTRCTPYGLFASCSIGNFDDSTNIQLSATEYIHRHGRLDMDYVCELHSHLLKQKEIIDQLDFFPNNSIYRLGDQWRYIEHRFTKETGRSYHLVEIDRSSYLQKILEAAELGQKPQDLAALITNDEISLLEANEFIYELIQSQVLINELEPSVTGEEYFFVLLRKLKTLRHTEKYVDQLEKIAELLCQLKNNNEEKNKIYPQIVQELQSSEVPLHLKTLIQVDSYRPAATCTLNKKINDEILKGISLLQLLTQEHPIKDTFSDFKTAFINRYEGEFVPLVEALDTESGIGYGKFLNSGMEESPLIDKLPIGNGLGAPSSLLQDIESFKWQLYQQAISENKTELMIDDKVIEQLSKKEFTITGLADSIYTMIKINTGSANDIDNDSYTITLQSPSGPSAGNLLGRFCHLHRDIEKLTRSILEEEEAHHPDSIYAEIVHLPESRLGNILIRPLLREYEIPYLCGSTLGKEFQIQVSDLLVGIENNKVILRSRRLNKQIIPRLTTAHNFNLTTLPVYQFLCDVQFQGIRHIGWQWGVLDNRPFLPRVSYGRFILSKAKWMLTKDDIKGFDEKSDEQILKHFAEVRKRMNLPEYILLSQGDNELLLHLKNIFCMKLLVAEVNKTGTVLLTETMDLPGQCWIKSSKGHYAGEFIFAFNRKIDEAKKPSDFLPRQIQKNIKRVFQVGSEWLYAKIYCGTKTAEKILCNVLKPFTEELLSEKLIDKFFFLRYHDAGHHIRIRFHNSSKNDFWQEVISRFQKKLQPYFDNHTVHNLQFETYRREVERYGSDTIHLSEDIFFYHSQMVLNFISLLDGDEGEQYRWQVGLKAIDSILDDFNYSIDRKCNLMRSLNKNFSDEFKIGSAERKKISERFGDHKQILNTLLTNNWKMDNNLSVGIGVFKEENKCYKETINELLFGLSNDHSKLDQLMSSYLHMFINRLFVSNQRKIELILYEYLFKYHNSKLKQKENNKILSPGFLQ